MRWLLSILVMPAFMGCATSTGVIPTGDGTFSVSHQDTGIASSLGGVRSAAYQEAARFCEARGQALSVIGMTDVPRSFGQFPESEVRFHCVPK